MIFKTDHWCLQEVCTSFIPISFKVHVESFRGQVYKEEAASWNLWRINCNFDQFFLRGSQQRRKQLSNMWIPSIFILVREELLWRWLKPPLSRRRTGIEILMLFLPMCLCDWGPWSNGGCFHCVNENRMCHSYITLQTSTDNESLLLSLYWRWHVA